MAKKVRGKYTYEKVEVLFNTENEKEMQLYDYLKSKSNVIGKSNYIKQILLDKMEGK